MEALRIFENNQFGKIRTSLVNNEPIFYAKDICNVLGYSNASKALSDHVDEDDRYNESLERGGSITMITESGLYSLILRSNKPEAKPFKKWITSEVLPSIRKSGGYMTSIPEETPEETMARALMIAQNTIERTKQENERLRMQSQLQADELHKVAPKAKYYDTVLQSTETYATTRIAMEIGMSAIALNNKLRSMRVQRRVDGQWVLYAEHAGKGYVKPHTFTYTKPNGETGTNTQTVWTEKGRQFIHSLFK